MSLANMDAANVSLPESNPQALESPPIFDQSTVELIQNLKEKKRASRYKMRRALEVQRELKELEDSIEDVWNDKRSGLLTLEDFN